jgi:peptidoglycan/LPS O-acetylase OafA/YrhL
MIGAVVSSNEFMSWLNLRPLRFLGRISYSFYLFHWPIFYLCAIAALRLKWLAGGDANLVVCATSIAVTLVVSALSYRFIEMPGIALGKRLSEKPR